MRFNLSLLRFLSFSLFLTFSAITARAQSDRGTIAGTVLDSSGGVVANAAVTVTSTETGASYSATSGPTGGFRVQDVRVGTYDVSVSAPGFRIEKKTGVVIQVNSTASLEFSLQAGNVTEILTVVADAPAIQTETSEIGTVVGTRQIEELPLALNGTGQSHLRSVESFVFLTPGTVGPGTFSDSASSGIFESNISAEFGRTSGGVESFTTKSGTNSYHGAAFDLLHNDKLNAVPWNNISNGSNVKPRDHQNDYGGSFGGNIVPGDGVQLVV